jgi:hypothetical protein
VNFKETTEQLYDRYMKFFSIDESKFLDTKWTSRRVDLSGIESALFNCKLFMNLNYHGFALEILNSYLYRRIRDYTRLLDLRDDVFESDENLQQTFVILSLIRETKFTYKLWLNSEYQMYLDTFIEFKYISEDKLKANYLSPRNIIEAKQAVGNVINLKTTHKLLEGEVITERLFNKPLYLYPKIIMSDDVNEWFDFQKNFSFKTHDKLVVSLFLRIDRVELDFSQFMLLISYKGNVWVQQIGGDFNNPYGKGVIAGRYNEKKYRYTDKEIPFDREGGLELPWFLLDDVTEHRKQGSLRNSKYSAEYYFEDWQNVHPSYPFYFYHYAKFLLDNIDEYKGDYGQTISLKGFIDNPKFLIGQQDNGEVKSDDFVNYKGVDEFYQDLIGTALKGVKSSELTVVNKDVVKNDRYYDENWVGTVDRIEKLTRWYLLNKKADSVREHIQKNYNRDRDREILSDMLSQKFERVKELVFNFDEIYVKNNFEIEQFGSRGCQTRFDKLKYNVKGRKEGIYSTIPIDAPNLKRERQRKRSFYDEHSLTCQCCNKTQSSHFYTYFHIKKWSDLCYILDCERDDLPYGYQNYHYYGLIPYKGNTLLQDTNPLYNITDPMSKDYSNGIYLTFSYCGWCAKKINKGNYLLVDEEKNVIKHEVNPDPKSHYRIIKQ